MNYSDYEDDTIFPHVPHHDNLKTGIYAAVGLFIAALLIVGTVMLFILA